MLAAMTTTETSGHDRRQAIAEVLRTTPEGWMTTVALAEHLGIDRATVYHHATKMVEQGTAAVGWLRKIGESGRPSRVVIDPDRLSDIHGTFELTETLSTGVTDTYTCQIEVTTTPDEYARPRVGPVTRALREGATTDDLARAVSEQIADALLADFRAGKIRLEIVPVHDDSTAVSPT